jgi:hypothetical protein
MTRLPNSFGFEKILSRLFLFVNRGSFKEKVAYFIHLPA